MPPRRTTSWSCSFPASSAPPPKEPIRPFRCARPTAISILKNTSLLSTITVVELTLYAQTLISATFRPFDFYIAVALIYLVLTTMLTRLASWLEHRYGQLS